MGALGVPELTERVKRTGRRFEKGGMTEKELGRNKEVGARQVGGGNMLGTWAEVQNPLLLMVTCSEDEAQG